MSCLEVSVKEAASSEVQAGDSGRWVTLRSQFFFLFADAQCVNQFIFAHFIVHVATLPIYSVMFCV